MPKKQEENAKSAQVALGRFFRTANLLGSSIANSKILNSEINYADLSGVTLSNNKLLANFDGSDLSNSVFEGENDIYASSFEQTNFKGAKVSDNAKLLCSSSDDFEDFTTEITAKLIKNGLDFNGSVISA